MALTATANEQVMNDVIDRLRIQGCVLLTQSFNRPNLHYDVRPKRRNVLADINAFIRTQHHGETGIIYCLSRNKCEEVARELRETYGLRAKHYHAHMSMEDKARAQNAWQNGDCELIVATVSLEGPTYSNTFIVSVIRSPSVWALTKRTVRQLWIIYDHAKLGPVRYVIHHSLPMSLDG